MLDAAGELGELGDQRLQGACERTDELAFGTGLGFAGGYVGTGDTAANLAGRTLTALVLGRDTRATSMPWVNRNVRRWEPEPLRWLGVQAMYAMYHRADRQEAGGRITTSPLAGIADRISGR